MSKPTPEEIREAAERLRVLESVGAGTAYKGFDYVTEAIMVDRDRLSQAYLAEHPADDATPLDGTAAKDAESN